MAKERNNVKAGLFILISMALALAILLGMRGAGMALEPKQNAVVQFTLLDDVAGLRTGSDVRVGGVRVGRVTGVNIRQSPGQAPAVVVDFNLPRRFELKQDAIVEIQAGLTGTVHLNVASLGTSQPAGNTPIVGSGSALNSAIAGLDGVVSEARQLLANARTTTVPKVEATLDQWKATGAQIETTGKSADALVVQVKDEVKPVVERYNHVADNAAGAFAEVRSILGDSKEDLRTTFANLRATMDSIREKVPQILDKSSNLIDDVKVAVSKTNLALDEIQEVATNTKQATASARRLLADNRWRIDAMIESLQNTGTNLESATTEIRSSPWRLLYKPKPGEVENLNLYDAARQYATASRKLNNAAQALRVASEDPDVAPDQIQKLLLDLDQSFTEFKSVEDALWEKVQ